MKLGTVKPLTVAQLQEKPAPVEDTPEQMAVKVEKAAIATAANAIRRAKEMWLTTAFSSWSQVADLTGISIPPQIMAGAPITYQNLELCCTYTQLNAKAKVAVATTLVDNIKVSTAADYRKLGSASDTVAEYTVGEYKLKTRQVRAFEMFKRKFDAWCDNPDYAESAVLYPLEAGEGKTIVAAACIKYALSKCPLPKDTLSLYRILWLAPAAIVPSTRWKLKRCGLADNPQVWVMSHTNLMAKAMQPLFTTEKVNLFGNEVEQYVYHGPCPLLIIVDERHAFKKAESEKTMRYDAIIRASRGKTFVVEMSATPAVTVNDMRSFVLAANFRGTGELITDNNWGAQSSILAGTTGTTVPNASALERFRKRLGDIVIYPPKDRHKFRSKTKIKIVPFPNSTVRAHYDEALMRFFEAKERAKQFISERGKVTAQFTVLRMCESQIKCSVMAQLALQRHKEGFAPVTFHPFMDDIRDMALLYIKAGIPRSKISIIWGGAKPIPKHLIVTDTNEIGRMFSLMGEWQPRYLAAKEAGIEPPPCPLTEYERKQYKATLKNWTERKQRNMTPAEQAERDELLRRYRLFHQSAEERFVENMNFQEGRTEFCIVSMSAGGAGIDLDHQIVGVRPRHVYTNIAYYGEELIQVFGRCMRAGTLSNVTQEMIFFEDTIAAIHVAPLLDKKLSSILTFAQGSIIDFAALCENKASLADLSNVSRVKFRTDEEIEHEEPEDITEATIEDDDDV